MSVDSEEFRKRGKEMIDWICEYFKTLQSKEVVPDVERGYLRKLIPNEAPQNAETFEDLIKDINNTIIPGVCHWQHPLFHGYLETGCSFPSLLGDILCLSISGIGFSWVSNPACSELELVMMDWLAKAIGLPDQFLCDPDIKSGGVIQNTTTDCILVCMIAARNNAIALLKEKETVQEEAEVVPRLVVYCSEEAHSCIEKCANFLFVKVRILEADSEGSLRGPTLQKAIEEDRGKNLIPFFVVATLGTPNCICFDNVEEIAEVCGSDPSIWLHIDATIAGCTFICPELKRSMKGIERADSFNTNPSKLMLVHFDCAVLWVKESKKIIQAMTVDPVYLQHKQKGVDYRHWQIPLSRRFRSLKLWFVFRMYGLSGIRNYIMRHVKLAKIFEDLVRKNERFEVVNNVQLSLVVFRLKGSDELNQRLLSELNQSKKIFLNDGKYKGRYVLRFCVGAENVTECVIKKCWSVIEEYAGKMKEESKSSSNQEVSVTLTVDEQTHKTQCVFTDEASQIRVDVNEGDEIVIERLE